MIKKNCEKVLKIFWNIIKQVYFSVAITKKNKYTVITK